MSSANAQALSIRCVETSMSQGLHVVEETASLCLCVCVCAYIGLGLANVKGGGGGGGGANSMYYWR